MTNPADSNITGKLEAAFAELAKGHLPDAENRALIVQMGRTFIARPSRARDELRRTAKAERNKLLLELAQEHCADLRGIRPKVRRILSWARRYEVSGWRHDRHATTCPAHRIGKPEGIIWCALKAWPGMPGERRLHEILSTSKR